MLPTGVVDGLFTGFHDPMASHLAMLYTLAGEEIGYDRNLFILPFDHRASSQAGLLGIRGRQANPQVVKQISQYKRMI